MNNKKLLIIISLPFFLIQTINVFTIVRKTTISVKLAQLKNEVKVLQEENQKLRQELAALKGGTQTSPVQDEVLPTYR